MMLPLHSSVALAVLSAENSMTDAIGFLLTGITVVVATLLVLALVTSLVGWVFSRFPALAGAARSRSGKAVGRTVDDALMVVISSAVDQTLGGRYRVLSVKPTSKK